MSHLSEYAEKSKIKSHRSNEAASMICAVYNGLSIDGFSFGIGCRGMLDLSTSLIHVLRHKAFHGGRLSQFVRSTSQVSSTNRLTTMISQGPSPSLTGIKGRRRHPTHDGDEYDSHGLSMEILGMNARTMC